MQYEVVVGTSGIVHQGTSLTEARKVYDDFRRKSNKMDGKLAGESVALFANDSLILEHTGTLWIQDS